MTKPKSEVQKHVDKMGRLHNKMVRLIGKSNLDMSEVYVVLDNIKQSLLNRFRRTTGQE